MVLIGSKEYLVKGVVYAFSVESRNVLKLQDRMFSTDDKLKHMIGSSCSGVVEVMGCFCSLEVVWLGRKTTKTLPPKCSRQESY